MTVLEPKDPIVEVIPAWSVDAPVILVECEAPLLSGRWLDDDNSAAPGKTAMGGWESS